jgi:hypothetical protein
MQCHRQGDVLNNWITSSMICIPVIQTVKRTVVFSGGRDILMMVQYCCSIFSLPHMMLCQWIWELLLLGGEYYLDSSGILGYGQRLYSFHHPYVSSPLLSNHDSDKTEMTLLGLPDLFLSIATSFDTAIGHSSTDVPMPICKENGNSLQLGLTSIETKVDISFICLWEMGNNLDLLLPFPVPLLVET